MEVYYIATYKRCWIAARNAKKLWGAHNKLRAMFEKKRTVEQKILCNREKSCTADYENSAHLSTDAHSPIPTNMVETRFYRNYIPQE